MKRTLHRKMIAQAQRDGASNTHLVEIVAEYAHDWTAEFERKHRVNMSDKERSAAVDAFTGAFYRPEDGYTIKSAPPYDYVEDRLSRCDVPQK